MGTHPIFESDFDCLTDAKFFNEMQTQSTRCRIIRFMSTRDFVGDKKNYQ